jgi:fatty-acyl-CoA synthase
MLKGEMMERPLLIADIMTYAAEVYGQTEIVSAAVEGGIHRQTYRQAAARIAQLARALDAAGIRPGDRVATLAWNGYRHFELYYAISGLGAVCHTINPRLFPEQIAYIVNHAGDRLLFTDLTFIPLVEKLKGSLPPGLGVIAMTDRAHMPASAALPDLGCYEELLAERPMHYDWPELDERTAAALCYTSGTTGEPKGALYSHRSTVLHALCVATGNRPSFGAGRSILPVVPLFHVNAWGIPYSAPLTGTSIVMPGARLDGTSLFDLMDQEGVNSAWGVPTVWQMLLAEMRARGRAPKGFSQVIIGGAAPPRSMIEAFEKGFGVEVMQGWGMTEMSPIGTCSLLQPHERALPIDEVIGLKSKAGRRIFGVEMKIVAEGGRRLPHDGREAGDLYVRGNSISSGYFANEAASREAMDAEGWFKTGDVAMIDADGFMTITDRSKDLIKSGGEWISSIDVENAAAACPGIGSCAVIGVPHAKWGERPLLVVVPKAGETLRKDDVLAFLAGRIARWQLPDDVVLIDALPMTATGKVSKKDLRVRFKDHALPDVERKG